MGRSSTGGRRSGAWTVCEVIPPSFLVHHSPYEILRSFKQSLKDFPALLADTCARPNARGLGRGQERCHNKVTRIGWIKQ